MSTLKLNFTQLSAVIVLSLCMLCANNVKTYAQRIIPLVAGDGITLTDQDIGNSIGRYIEANDDSDFLPMLHTWTAVIQAKELACTFMPYRIISASGTVENIPDGAFAAMPIPGIGLSSALVTVNFPNAKTIGIASFYSLSALKEVRLPKVESIEAGVFTQCPNIEIIDLSSVEGGIDETIFANCKKLRVVYLNSIEQVKNAFTNFPALEEVYLQNAKTIGERAFEGCTSLKKIVCPNAEIVEESAFMGCTSLEAVDISKCKTIAIRGFADCAKLKEVECPKVETIGDVAFRMTSITSMNCPNLETIGYGAFYASDLKEIYFPKVKSIDESAFYRCKFLLQINCPEAETVNKTAFAFCSSLEEVYLPKLKSLEENIFEGCTSLKILDLSSVETIPAHTFQNDFQSLENVKLQKVKTIETSAFANCSSLEIVLCPDVKTIGDYAFYACESLQTMDCPNAETIGQQAFMMENSSTLSSINFPKVETMGAKAFYGCQMLSSAEFPKLNSISDGAFAHNTRLENLKFASCVSIDFSTCGAFVDIWSLKEITDANFPKLEVIGQASFHLTSLQKANLSNVWSIGLGAFKNNLSLSEAVFPKAIEIGVDAFNNCQSLESITLGTGHTTPQELYIRDYPDGSRAGLVQLRADDETPFSELTKNITLILGEMVLPKPNGNSWNGYTWKSVTVLPAITGIEKVVKSDVITVYPNPAKEYATVSFELEKGGYIKTALVDMSGKEVAVVYNGFAPAGMFHQTFGTAHLPSGVYLLNVSMNGSNTTKKIIIEN